MSNWIRVNEALPETPGFYWVKRIGGIELAYFWPEDDYRQGNWQDPYSLGDREGLSVEYYDDVTHWMELDKPSDPDDSAG